MKKIIFILLIVAIGGLIYFILQDEPIQESEQQSNFIQKATPTSTTNYKPKVHLISNDPQKRKEIFENAIHSKELIGFGDE